MVLVDLNRNTIDGKKHKPRVCELVSILADGPVATETIIRKMWGCLEPVDASNTVKSIAYSARQSGIPIKGKSGPGSYYWIDGLG